MKNTINPSLGCTPTHKTGYRKSMFLLVLIVLIAFSVYAVTTLTTSFYGQTNPFNATINASTNSTYYISVLLYAYSKNITVQIETIEIAQ